MLILLVAKLRRALFDESGHAFFLVGGGKQGVEQTALEGHAVGQAALEGLVDGLFGGLRGKAPGAVSAPVKPARILGFKAL